VLGAVELWLNTFAITSETLPRTRAQRIRPTSRDFFSRRASAAGPAVPPALASHARGRWFETSRAHAVSWLRATRPERDFTTPSPEASSATVVVSKAGLNVGGAVIGFGGLGATAPRLDGSVQPGFHRSNAGRAGSTTAAGHNLHLLAVHSETIGSIDLPGVRSGSPWTARPLFPSAALSWSAPLPPEIRSHFPEFGAVIYRSGGSIGAPPNTARSIRVIAQRPAQVMLRFDKRDLFA
jgi:hypothetical protein